MHALAGKPPRENSQFPAGFLKSVQTQPCFRLPNVLKRNEQNPARRHAAGRITLGIPGRDLPYTERPRSSMALSNLVHPSFLPRFDFHLRRQTMAPFETSSLPNTRPFLRTRKFNIRVSKLPRRQREFHRVRHSHPPIQTSAPGRLARFAGLVSTIGLGDGPDPNNRQLEELAATPKSCKARAGLNFTEA